MKTIKQVLEAKGMEILSISPDRSVYDAMEMMADNEVGALIVLEKGKVVGLITERDYARKNHSQRAFIAEDASRRYHG